MLHRNDVVLRLDQLGAEVGNCERVDKRFAYYRYVDGLSQNLVMDKMDWYSTSTFARHNKKVWARLIQTLKILAD